MTRALTLTVLTGRFAIVQLPADAPVPSWAPAAGELVSITRTRTELSIVCDQARVPDDVRSEGDWVCLRLEGAYDFSEIGVLASIAQPLADASVSIFALSTFDTDYLLVRANALDDATAALQGAGHRVVGFSSR